MIHADILGERARLSPENTAVVMASDGARYSYAALESRAIGCARMWLYGLGLRPGERVGILSGNRLEFLDAFFAAGKSGVVLVPLNTRLTVPELEFIIRDCSLRAVLYAEEHRESVRRLRSRVDVFFMDLAKVCTSTVSASCNTRASFQSWQSSVGGLWVRLCSSLILLWEGPAVLVAKL